MGEDIGLKKIVITGPESTGKTTLSESLALKLNAEWIPEYARNYIENLNRPYTSKDIETIAQYQIRMENRITKANPKGIFVFDTWLILTKVWFEVVYGTSPSWINSYISASNIDLFLVCSPDVPWIADPVRENGGEMRNRLFERYCNEIELFGFNYEIIEGLGEVRLQNALNILKSYNIE